MMKALRHLFAALSLLLCSVAASAQTFEVDGLSYTVISSDDYTVSVAKGSTEPTGEVDIPSTVTYENIEYRVTRIGGSAFSQCYDLRSITIPESVTSIGDHAFADCTSLENIPYLFSSRLTNIGDYAFYNCSSITSIYFFASGPTRIGLSAFEGCGKLSAISIPNVEQINARAFYNCSSIEGFMVYTTDNVLIGQDAFYGTAWYNNHPDGVVYFDNNVYKYKGEMPENTSIEIEEDTKTIAYGAFSGCANLTSVTIPESVTTILLYAFMNCTGLTSITCEAVTPPTNYVTDAFPGVNKSIPLYVPASAVSAYKEASYWSDFTNIKGIYAIDYVVGDETIQTNEVKEGTTVSHPTIENIEREGHTLNWVLSEAINIKDNADAMLYTNAPCTNTQWGDQFVGWHVLFDNDANTFFHSEYSAGVDSEDGQDHYLRVDLGEGNELSSFTFTYTVRGEIPYMGDYSPKQIVVEGSNSADGEYTQITLLTDLPHTAAAVYNSPVLSNGQEYRYIRFRVTETYQNVKVVNHPYFFMAEFGMEKHEVISDNSFTMPAKDITLIAEYVPNDYTVTFKHNDEVVATETFAYNTAVTPAEAPTRGHYTFVEWTGLPETMPARDIEVTAKYALTLTDGQMEQFACDKEEELTSITYNRTLLPEKRWNALYVPFEIELTEEFLTDYDVAYFNDFRCYDNDDDGAIDDMEMEVIKLKSGTLKANYPYLIRAKNDDARALNLVMADAIVYPTEVNTLTCSSVFMQFGVTGIYTRTPAESLPGCYAISSAGAWQPIAAGSNLGAFRLYLSMTTLEGSPVKVDEQSMRAIRIRTRGESEGTTTIENSEIKNLHSEIIYDLQGRRVENPSQGIYIVNGRKVVIK